MSAIASQIWARLSVEGLQGNALRGCLAVPDVTDRLLAGIDAAGRRHLLILLNQTDADFHDSQSRGISVITQELAIPDHAPGRYLDITCLDISGYETFNLIGGELAAQLSGSEESASQVVSRVLAKWRRFWGQAPRHLLSREEQLGLFAELWFLRVWLIPMVGLSVAVQRWRGPFGSRHDFEWAGKSVEVKATSSVHERVHRIHGLDQLLQPETGVLLLFSQRLREEAGATNSLPNLVASCREQLADEAHSLSQFEDALIQVGYSDADVDEYSQLRLRVVEEGLYQVQADFPRLTKSELCDGLLPGVRDVNYEIILDGFAHLCIARLPEQATML